MMCNCMAMARDFSEQDDAEFTGIHASIHHPKCEDYKLERFTRVVFDGIGCIMETGDAVDLMNDADRYPNDYGDYTHEDVFITRDQFYGMPEFTGW